MFFSRKRSFQRQMLGFSLVELLVAGVIVSILCSIALPSYQAQHIRQIRQSVQLELGTMILEIEALRGVLMADFNPAVINLEPLLSKASVEHYRFSVFENPEVGMMSYYLVAYPRTASIQKGDGALSITSEGDGCWHQGNDRPKNAACFGVEW